MNDNPLDADKHRQQRISERAYHLWQAEGELHGHDREYWERAEELIGMEDSAGAGQLPNPMGVPGNDPSRPLMVEEASIQENLGEFPGQTDQGEHLHTPSAQATHEREDASPAPVGTDRLRETASATAATKPVSEKKSRLAAGKEKGVTTAPKNKESPGKTDTAAGKAKSGKAR